MIKLFFADHNPPHFHAVYGADEVVIDIHTLAAMGGRIPPRAMGLVVEWGALHQQELLSRWNTARRHQPLDRIAPLA